MKELERAKVHLLIDSPFFSYLLMHLQEVEAEVIVTNREIILNTCAVDGTHLYYNPEWIKSLTVEETMGVLAHEVYHCALGHIIRIGTRDRLKWNYATDYSINSLLLQDGFELPKGCLYDKQFEDMAAEQIYPLLPDPPQTPSGGGGKGTLDNHDVWENAQGGDGDKDGEDGNGNGKAPVYDPVVWKERVARAATQARMAGKLPGHIASLVEDLVHPKLDWRVILRDFIQSTIKSNYRLFPANKRYLWIPLYLPSTYGDSVEVAIGIDTSGSMSDEDIRNVISEVKGITEQFDSFTLHIFQCDAAVQSYDVVTAYEGEIPTKVLGRGGTSFHPVLKEIEDRNLNVPCLLYMTDGYPNSGWPDQPAYPVLWIMTTDVEPPFGEVVRLEER